MKILVIGALFAILAAFGLAQEPTYRLQPEDVIRVQVYGEQQINATIPIGRDGNISAPFVGIVRAQGRTTSELEAALAEEYIRRLRLRDPRVSVIIEQFRRVRASVSGQAFRPGTYEMRPTDRILQLLSSAGGAPLDGSADLRRAVLQRSDTNESIPIDLYAMLQFNDLSQNYLVLDGDQLIIPNERNNQIYVLGAVQAPGAFRYLEPMRVSDAIALARDAIPYRSKFSSIVIARQPKGRPGEWQYIPVNFVAFKDQRDPSQNILLQPGDILFVPESDTPDLQRIGQLLGGLANAIFTLERFGLDVFGSRR